MLEFPRWKYALILLVVLLSALYALPNLYPQDPSLQISANRGAVLDETLNQRIQQTLAGVGVTPKSIEREGDNLLVRLPSLDAQTKAADTLRPALGDEYLLALNLASTVPDWLSWFGARPMMLGLDLQGGVHFVLQVDQKAALEKRIDAYAEDFRVTLRDNRIRYRSVERRADGSIQVALSSQDDAEQARRLLATAQPTLGYAVQGDRIVVNLPQAELDRIATDSIEQNITTLRNRVDEIGVAEPVIQRQGADRVVVQLPGVQDTATAKRTIGATATLEYRAVVDGNAADALATGRVPPEARIRAQET